MTQFALGLQACQTESNFARAYSDGVHKSKYWERLWSRLEKATRRGEGFNSLYRRSTDYIGLQ
jgi:hypothetical protein